MAEGWKSDLRTEKNRFTYRPRDLSPKPENVQNPKIFNPSTSQKTKPPKPHAKSPTNPDSLRSRLHCDQRCHMFTNQNPGPEQTQAFGNVPRSSRKQGQASSFSTSHRTNWNKKWQADMVSFRLVLSCVMVRSVLCSVAGRHVIALHQKLCHAPK